MTTEASTPTRRRAAFGFIFASALLNAVSFGITIPILPGLIKDFAGGDTAAAAEWVMLFGAVWGVMQFICGPILGVLSDRIGRRPVLLISFLGLAFDFLFLVFAPSLMWLFVARIVNGMTAGCRCPGPPQLPVRPLRPAGVAAAGTPQRPVRLEPSQSGRVPEVPARAGPAGGPGDRRLPVPDCA